MMNSILPLYLAVACSPEVSQSSGDAPVPVPASDERPLPQSAAVVLGPSEAWGGATSRAMGRSALSDSRTHPDAERLERFLFAAYGENNLVIGLGEREGQWWASADLDGSGRIDPTEQVQLAPTSSDERDELGKGVLQGAVERSVPERFGGGTVSVPVNIRIRVQRSDADESLKFSWAVEHVRTGALPDGTVVALISKGGVYDHPRARIVVDENGDGEADYDNLLVGYYLGDGRFSAQGHRWAVVSHPAGDQIVVEKTTEAPVGLRVGSPAPAFSLTASDGATHTLDTYKGAPLLLDFWATWCAPCIALHPEVEATQAEYGVAVLGISADDERETVTRWLQANPTPWPSAVVGPEGQVNQDYNVQGWPTQALVDAQGRMRSLGTLEAAREALAGMKRSGELETVD